MFPGNWFKEILGIKVKRKIHPLVLGNLNNQKNRKWGSIVHYDLRTLYNIWILYHHFTWLAHPGSAKDGQLHLRTFGHDSSWREFSEPIRELQGQPSISQGLRKHVGHVYMYCICCAFVCLMLRLDCLTVILFRMLRFPSGVRLLLAQSVYPYRVKLASVIQVCFTK